MNLDPIFTDLNGGRSLNRILNSWMIDTIPVSYNIETAKGCYIMILDSGIGQESGGCFEDAEETNLPRKIAPGHTHVPDHDRVTRVARQQLKFRNLTSYAQLDCVADLRLIK